MKKTLFGFLNLLKNKKKEQYWNSIIIENTFEAIALVDLGKTNLLTYVNPAWEKMFGYKSSEVVGKREGLIIAASKLDKELHKKFSAAISNGYPFSSEMQWKKKDGSLLWVEVFSLPVRDKNGNILIWFNTIRDISVERDAKQKIQCEKRRAELYAKDLEKFKLAVENASDHIIITDNNGVVIYANKAASEITGYANKEILNKEPGELWGGHMPKQFYENMWCDIKNKKKSFVGEVNNKRKNGQEYVAEIHIAPVMNDAGNVKFFVGIERDITKAKEIDRMKTEFVSIASHQLRTPLTGVKWFIEILANDKKYPLKQKQKEYVKNIDDSNERLIHIVDDLLNVSRIDTGMKFDIAAKKVDIAPIIKAVVDEQNVTINSNNIAVRFNNEGGRSIIVMADEDKIRQVFQNLINNAIKYSRENSEISVGCKEEKDRNVFYVKDNGIGIPKHEQEKVFQKFFRAENAMAMQAHGTGLGLYIVKAIVAGHNGKIWFESEENVGTTFYVSLPKKELN